MIKRILIVIVVALAIVFVPYYFGKIPVAVDFINSLFSLYKPLSSYFIGWICIVFLVMIVCIIIAIVALGTQLFNYIKHG
jgi:hypothetical protein